MPDQARSLSRLARSHPLLGNCAVQSWLVLLSLNAAVRRGEIVSADRLRLGTMISFGFGQISEAVKNVGFNTFLLFYYNQVLGVSATLTSIALASALVFDAVTDPVAGALSDKTRSRWGRRHPFILIASVPLAITFFLLFNPPENLTESAYFLWLLTFAVLTRAAMTFYHIPHLALGAELATNYDQRSTLYAFNTFFASLGAGIFAAVSYRFFFPNTAEFNPGPLDPNAYSSWTVFAGAIMIIAILVCVFGTRSEIPRLRAIATKAAQERFGIRRLGVELASAFRNRSFRAIFFGMMLGTFIISVEAVFQPFMGFHFWGMTSQQLSLIPLVSMLGLFSSLVAIRAITKKFDKKPTLIGSALLTILNINIPIVLALFDVSWFPERGSTALLVILMVNATVTGFLGPIIFATLNSMFADITDEHELEVGERREGIIFSARAFAVKATSSFGLIFGGVLLDWIQFPRGAITGEVAEAIVWQLGVIAGPATSVFTFFGMALYLRYRIDRKRHLEITEALAIQRSEFSEIRGK
ncbi:uncharacterized protein METZ01_LOCUS24554 [marine metagenome]|uniref:Major facilitator superfamily (MFS) profile domain-containing protein n=1 Tax=marine metagenome TaxID=408172 RepID=A0A381PXX3_9ZZZZ